MFPRLLRTPLLFALGLACATTPVSHTAGPVSLSAVAAEPPTLRRAESGSPRIGVATFAKSVARSEQLEDWLRDEGFDVEPVAESRLGEGALEGLDLLVVPRAPDLPPTYWAHLPPAHAKGLHLLFEGVPLKTGRFGASKFEPGLGPDLHLYYETGELPGLPARGALQLRPTSAGAAGLGLPRALVAEGGGTRSIQKIVHRYKRDTTGNRAYREDLVHVPFAIFDEEGELRSQQAVLVRHHCRVFRGATTAFVDITRPQQEGYALLAGAAGSRILASLVRQALGPFPGERSQSEYDGLHALKEGLETLRQELVRAEYAFRDLVVLAEHGQQGPAVLAGLETPLAAATANALAQLETYHQIRAADPSVAWRHYPSLLAEVKTRARELSTLRQKLEASRDQRLAATDRRELVLPGAELVYGFASTQVRWGFRDGPILDAMQEAGMESYTDWVYDRSFLEARGNPKLSLYEFLDPLPSQDEETWALPRSRSELDLETGEQETVDDPDPIFDPLYETQAYRDWLARVAKERAEDPWINSRVITTEKALGAKDGHGPEVQTLYRGFLRERHRTVEALNRRWGSSYREFDEIVSPRRFPEQRSQRANWFDFVDFRSKAVTRHIDRIGRVFREFDSRHAIVGSLNQQGPMSGVDLYEINGVLDRVSTHNWPTSLPWYNPGLAAKPKQRGENNELKATRAAYRWTPKNERGSQWRARFYTLYTYAHGVVEQEEHHWGILGGGRKGERGRGLFGEADGYVRLAAAEVGELNRTKSSWEGFAGGTPPKDTAEVGLYWSFATKSQGRGVPANKRLGEDFFFNAFQLNDLWNGWFDTLQVPFETVPRQKVHRGQLAHLKLVVIPEAPFIDAMAMEGLLAWVHDGGHLVVVGNSGHMDEYAAPVDGLLGPVGLRVEAAPESAVQWQGKALTAPRLHPVHHQKRSRLAIQGEGLQILASYPSGRGAAVRKAYGKGQVTVLGFDPALDKRIASGGLSPSNSGRRFFLHLLEEAGVSREAWGTDPQDRLAIWHGSDGWRYGVVQNYTAKRRTATVHIRGKVEGLTDLTLALPLRSRFVDGATRLRLPLLPGDGRVVAWRTLGER